jgi:hypothetical protein
MSLTPADVADQQKLKVALQAERSARKLENLAAALLGHRFAQGRRGNLDDPESESDLGHFTQSNRAGGAACCGR